MKKILSYIYKYLSLLLRRDVYTPFYSKIDINSDFEGLNFIGRYSVIFNTKVGRGTYIGNNCHFSHCLIGRFCSISQDVKVIVGNHPTSIFVSTHPLFYAPYTLVGKGFTDKCLFNEFKKTQEGYSAIIGNDVWIGSNAYILEGVKVGDGAIIAAKSFVNKDIPPYSIVGGVPAKIIRYRFSQEEIDKLLKIKWWNWPINKIKSNALDFTQLSVFVDAHKDELDS